MRYRSQTVYVGFSVDLFKEPCPALYTTDSVCDNFTDSITDYTTDSYTNKVTDYITDYTTDPVANKITDYNTDSVTNKFTDYVSVFFRFLRRNFEWQRPHC